MAAEKTHNRPCNFVHRDRIWKNHVNAELETAKAWSDKWGFLKDTYNEESSQTNETFELTEDLRRCPSPTLKENVKVEPSPPLPQTTQGFIGWRSTVPELQLEFFGKVHHGRRSFVKALGWESEACS